MGNTKSAQEHEPEAITQKPKEGFGKFYSSDIKRLKKPCCATAVKILFIVIAILTMIQSIVVIAVTIGSAVASKLYNKEQSSRLVAMIILTVTAAVTLSMVTYAVIAVFRHRKKPIHATAAAMLIIAIIQAVILGVSMRVTTEDEILLNRSLIDSFRLAREDNPRHLKLWATTQSDLNCCGVYSAEDYRRPNIPNYFSPDVPISCCPGYEATRSELVQERERESCKARREYYEIGCKAPILEMFRFTCTLVMANTILLIICELFLAIVGMVHINARPKEEEPIEVAPTPMPRVSLTKTKSVLSTA